MTTTHPSTQQTASPPQNALKPQGAKSAVAQSNAVQGLIDFITQLMGAEKQTAAAPPAQAGNGTSPAQAGNGTSPAQAGNGTSPAQAPVKATAGDNASAAQPSAKTAAGDNPQTNDIVAALNNLSPDTTTQTDATGLDPAILSQLEQKFASLTEDGQPLTQDALAQFKTDALKMLKDMGISADDAQKYMLALTQQLGSHVTNAQAAWLILPVQPPAQHSAQQDIPKPAQQDIPKPAQQGIPKPVQQAVQQTRDAAKVAQQNPAPQGTDNKPAVGGLVPDKTNNGLPQQQASSAPQAPQQSAPPAPQKSADTQGQGAHAATASAHNNGSSGGSGGSTSGDGGGFSNATGSLLAGTADGVKTALSQGQSFSSVLTQTQAAPHIPQMVAVQIQRNMAANVNTFTMRLDPEELGALEVRMSFGKDGSVKTHLIADKPETLTLLKHDAPQINRLLQQAGLNADEGSLSFDLRQQNQQHGQDDGYTAGGAGAGRARGTLALADNAIHAKIAVESAGLISPSGVNIMV